MMWRLQLRRPGRLQATPFCATGGSPHSQPGSGLVRLRQPPSDLSADEKKKTGWPRTNVAFQTQHRTLLSDIVEHLGRESELLFGLLGVACWARKCTSCGTPTDASLRGLDAEVVELGVVISTEADGREAVRAGPAGAHVGVGEKCDAVEPAGCRGVLVAQRECAPPSSTPPQGARRWRGPGRSGRI